MSTVQFAVALFFMALHSNVLSKNIHESDSEYSRSISVGAPLPVGVVNCRDAQNQQNCSTLCVGDGWFSKITSGNVNAKQICIDQGYDGKIIEYGGNDHKQCKYPGDKFGTPNKGGGSFESFGFFVTWSCSGGCQYVHLLNPNGHPAGTTCETLGLESIRKMDECYVAYKSIADISGYTTYGSILPCFDHNPNYCITNTITEDIYFTPDHCPIHASKSDSYEGMICKECTGD